MFHWFCGIWAVFFLMEFNLKNILLLFVSDITIWLYTKRAQFPELKFPKHLPQFWTFHEDIFSLCEYKLSLYFLRWGRKN